MIHWKKVMFGSALFGAGLGLGTMGTFILTVGQEPAIIIEEKWTTVSTAPTPPVVLGHTSLNEDELRTLLTIMATTTTTTLPVSSTTSTVPVQVTPTPTTQMPLPPSTLPSSSTTSPTLTDSTTE